MDPKGDERKCKLYPHLCTGGLPSHLLVCFLVWKTNFPMTCDIYHWSPSLLEAACQWHCMFSWSRGCGGLSTLLFVMNILIVRWWRKGRTHLFGKLVKYYIFHYISLGGDTSNTFGIFNPILGEMVEFDEHIFQMGWFNHQLVLLNALVFVSECVESMLDYHLSRLTHGLKVESCQLTTLTEHNFADWYWPDPMRLKETPWKVVYMWVCIENCLDPHLPFFC